MARAGASGCARRLVPRDGARHRPPHAVCRRALRRAFVTVHEDGDLEIDNNGAERSLRGIAVGRKNWLWYGSDKGGQTAAILTSFTATCKRLHCHIEPFAYLRDIFDRISAHPSNRRAELLPDRWKLAQAPDTS